MLHQRPPAERTVLHAFRRGIRVGYFDAYDGCSKKYLLPPDLFTLEDNGFYEGRRSFTCTSKKFVDKGQMSTYGERIAAFCADYESIFTERVYTKRNKISLEMMAENALCCFICSGNCGDMIIQV